MRGSKGRETCRGPSFGELGGVSSKSGSYLSRLFFLFRKLDIASISIRSCPSPVNA